MQAFRFDNISYAHDKNIVLDKASFSINAGQVHAILGMNGSGKSTVAKLLSGSVSPDMGTISYFDEPVTWSSPIQARKNGVATVYMSYELVDNLRICENIFAFGFAYTSRRMRRCSLKKMASMAQDIFDEFEIDLDPYAYPHELSSLQSLMVQLAMVASQDPKVIVLDDPFALLERRESKYFGNFIKHLKEKNSTIVFTTSDIGTAITLSDEITIIKDGKTVTYDNVEERSVNFYAETMSDTVSYKYPRIKSSGNDEVLRVSGLSTINNVISDVAFTQYKGEILGVAGTLGAGRSTLARALFGLQFIKSGKIFIDGSRVYIENPRDAIDCGIGYMHDTGGESGIIDDFSITENITLANLKEVSEKGIINKMTEMEMALRFIKNYSIRPSDLNLEMRMHTDGNKQKTIFSRWMFKESRIIIMDKITRGLDTSSKVELYNFMNRFAMSGGSILFISDDYNELIGMCDRIMIMNGGRINSILSGEEISMLNLVDGVSGIGRE